MPSPEGCRNWIFSRRRAKRRLVNIGPPGLLAQPVKQITVIYFVKKITFDCSKANQSTFRTPFIFSGYGRDSVKVVSHDSNNTNQSVITDCEQVTKALKWLVNAVFGLVLWQHGAGANLTLHFVLSCAVFQPPAPVLHIRMKPEADLSWTAAIMAWCDCCHGVNKRCKNLTPVLDTWHLYFILLIPFMDYIHYFYLSFFCSLSTWHLKWKGAGWRLISAPF